LGRRSGESETRINTIDAAALAPVNAMADVDRLGDEIAELSVHLDRIARAWNNSPLSAPAGGGVGPAPDPGRSPRDAHAEEPWADGTRHLPFEPLTLLEKLAAPIPRPRINRVLYHGVLAPHAGWRAGVVTYGATPAVASTPSKLSDESTLAPVARHWAWAALMRRAFDLDVLRAPAAACGCG